MRPQYYTSIGQSKHLLELGLNPETADMFYMRYKDGLKPPNGDADLNSTHQSEDGDWYSVDLYDDYYEMDYFKKDGIYAWSLGALLGVMPLINDGISNCLPYISKWFYGQDEGKPKYIGAYVRETLQACAIVSLSAETPVDACYKIVVWLLENNYIKKSNQL